jgi:hypothetical protein
MIFTGAARRTRTVSGSLGRWNPATRSRRRLCCDSSGPGDRSHRLGPIAWLSSWRSRKSGSAARRAGLSLRKAPGSPPGGSDLPLHRLPENSPVEAVTLGALSRALVQVVMFTLSTPVPAKLASRGGHGCPARLRGRGFRTGSDRVPVGFRAVSHSQDSIIIRRFRSPARAERGRIPSDRYVTSSRQGIATTRRGLTSARCGTERSSRRSVFGMARSPISRTRSPSGPCSVHTKVRWWSCGDSNPGPAACKAAALPPELQPRRNGR